MAASAGIGVAIDGEDLVAFFEAGLIGGHARHQIGDGDGIFFRSPAGKANLIDAGGFGHDGLVERLSAALDLHIQRLTRAQRLFQFDLLPGGILNVVDAGDAVAQPEIRPWRRQYLSDTHPMTGVSS